MRVMVGKGRVVQVGFGSVVGSVVGGVHVGLMGLVFSVSMKMRLAERTSVIRYEKQ